MQAELSEKVVGSSGEVVLWRAVIDQALQDAVTPERFTNGKPTFASVEGGKARYWFGRGGRDFHAVCAYADLDEGAVSQYAAAVIAGGGRRRRARKPVG